MPRTDDLDRPDVTTDRGDGAARRSADPGFLMRTLRVLGLAAGVAIGMLLLIYSTEVFLLAFAGVLVAVLLRTPADWLSARTGLPAGAALALVVLGIVVFFGGLGWLTMPRLIEQAREFAEQLPQALNTLGEAIGAQMNLGDMLPAAEAVLGRVPGIVTTTFGAVAAVFIVVVTGLYLAARPEMYVAGVVQLFPLDRRAQARQLLGEIGHILQRWLAGQLVAMAAVGVLTYIGLTALGVPLALGLAVLTGLLEFVPYIGPVLAAVPALLLAFTEDTTLALYVLGLYVAVQAAESYLITPLVQQRAAYLPPALLILVQVMMGVLFGFLGILLATPLAAVALVAVKRLYVEGVLGDDVDGDERDGA